MKHVVIFITAIVVSLYLGYVIGGYKKTHNVHLSFFKCYQTGDVIYNPQLFGKTIGESKFSSVLVDVVIVNPSASHFKEVRCD